MVGESCSLVRQNQAIFWQPSRVFARIADLWFGLECALGCRYVSSDSRDKNVILTSELVRE